MAKLIHCMIGDAGAEHFEGTAVQALGAVFKHWVDRAEADRLQLIARIERGEMAKSTDISGVRSFSDEFIAERHKELIALGEIAPENRFEFTAIPRANGFQLFSSNVHLPQEMWILTDD